MSVLDNKRYKEMELAPGVYVPDMGIAYPEDDPMTRIVPVKKVRDIKADESYPFVDNSFKAKFMRNFAYIFVVGFALRIYCFVCLGLRINGRDVLKRYSKELSKGAVSVSNHCFRLDAVMISFALRRRMWIPMLSDLFCGSNHVILKAFGGIPLADGSLSATKKFNEAFDLYHDKGEWVHFFAEARSWLYYKPLRPFQKGAFTMAYKWNCPVLPMNISYRERTGIYRLFGKKELPLFTVNIGEPIFPDNSAPRKLEVERLTIQTHEAICKLGGIIRNPWPSIWND